MTTKRAGDITMQGNRGGKPDILLEKYLTAGEERGPEEIQEKGSRFISYLYPVKSTREAEEHLELLRTEYHDATHVCFALRLGEGIESYSRFSDDGEPGGTAGAPIYNEIKGKDYYNVLVAVVRYYGGTKLGTGGLARAYGASARQVIGTAGPLTVHIKKHLSLDFPFGLTGEMMQLINRFSLDIVTREYTADGVCMTLAVPVARLEDVAKTLAGIGGGSLHFR